MNAAIEFKEFISDKSRVICAYVKNIELCWIKFENKLGHSVQLGEFTEDGIFIGETRK